MSLFIYAVESSFGKLEQLIFLEAVFFEQIAQKTPEIFNVDDVSIVIEILRQN